MYYARPTFARRSYTPRRSYSTSRYSSVRNFPVRNLFNRKSKYYNTKRGKFIKKGCTKLMKKVVKFTLKTHIDRSTKTVHKMVVPKKGYVLGLYTTAGGRTAYTITKSNDTSVALFTAKHPDGVISDGLLPSEMMEAEMDGRKRAKFGTTDV